MVKAYLRYQYDDDFGVLTSADSNVVFDVSGSSAICGTNESVSVWDVRTNDCVAKLSRRQINPSAYDFSSTGTVSRVSVHPTKKNLVAVGYSDGCIRCWNIEERIIVLTLHGHKSGVTVLEFSLDGHLLASGSYDTDIVIWDLVSQAGLFRLRGHKRDITAARFLYPSLKSQKVAGANESADPSEGPASTTTKRSRSKEPSPSSSSPIEFVELASSPHLLLSGSKDGTVKVWDVATQWCLQTIYDSSGEVWSIAVNPLQTRLAVGSSDPQVKVYEIALQQSQSNPDEIDATVDVDSKMGATNPPSTDVLRFLGSISRPGKRGRASHLLYAVDVEGLINQFLSFSVDDTNNLASQRLAGDSYKECVSSCGTLLTDNSRQFASSNIQQLLLLICPSTKSCEVYKELTPSERFYKLKKRKRRTMEKLKQKQGSLESTRKLCAQVEAELGDGQITTRGTHFDADRDTLLNRLEKLTLAIDELKKVSTVSVPTISDEFEHLATLKFKKKPVSFDYCQLNWNALVSYGDNSLDVFQIPVASLLALKGSSDRLSAHQIDNEDQGLSFRPIYELSCQGHSTAPMSVAISHDDSTFASFADETIRMWNADTKRLIRYMSVPEKITCGFFVAGNAHIVVGTAQGSLFLLDVVACLVSQKLVKAHDASITGMSEHPNKTGFASVSRDKWLRFFQFRVIKEQVTEGVQCRQIGEVQLMDEGIGVKFSPNGKFVAVSLLDFTIQLFYTDTVKLHLTLYGHKLPATCLDMSSDSTLMISGSGDKTLKLWALDFGNILKSWHAHDEGVTQVIFLKDTHYAVSSGKDCLIKLWDTDRRELICQLLGHTKAVTSLVATRLDADKIIAAGLDRSIRVWIRTEEQIFACEEKEKIVEQQLDKEAVRSDVPIVGVSEEVVMSRATRKTIESIKSTENLMSVIDVVTGAYQEMEDYNQALQTWKILQAEKLMVKKESSSLLAVLGTAAKPLPPAPKMELGQLSPFQYLFTSLATLTAPIMHEVIVTLPFSFAEKLLHFIGRFLCALDSASHAECKFFGLHSLENVARVALLIIHLHMRQLIVSPTYRDCLVQIQKYLRPVLLKEKDRLQFNNTSLQLLCKRGKENLNSFAFLA